MKRETMIMIGGAALVGVALVWIKARGAGSVAESIASGAVDVAVGTVGGVVKGVAGTVGIPNTNADKARALMDRYAVAPWTEQAGLAFQISGYASAGDYLRWVLDKSYRPAPGAY